MELIPPDISVKPNSVAIVGWEAAVAGQVHDWLESTGDHSICCFVNPALEPPDVDIELEKTRRDCQTFSYPHKDSFKGLPLITSLDWYNVLVKLGIKKVLVSTSQLHDKVKHIRQARDAGLKFVNAIHPTATLLEKSVIHENVIIFARAVVGYKAEICTGAELGVNSLLDHHNIARECCYIGPGVTAAGNVTVGECAYVFTNATLAHKVKVGKNAVVGAGAVVTENVPENDTVVGVPARSIRK